MSKIDTDSNKQSNMDNFLDNKAYSFDDIVDNYKLYDYDSVKHHFYYKNTNLGYIQSLAEGGTRICLKLNTIDTCIIYKGDVIYGDKIEIETSGSIIDTIDRFEDAFVHKIVEEPSPEDIRTLEKILEPIIEARRKIEAQATHEYTLEDSELDFEANTKFNADKFKDNTMYTFNYIINLYRIYDYDSVKHHFYYNDKDLGYIQRMTPPDRDLNRIYLTLNNINTVITNKFEDITIKSNDSEVGTVNIYDQVFLHKIVEEPSPEDRSAWNSFLEQRIIFQRYSETLLADKRERRALRYKDPGEGKRFSIDDLLAHHQDKINNPSYIFHFHPSPTLGKLTYASIRHYNRSTGFAQFTDNGKDFSIYSHDGSPAHYHLMENDSDGNAHKLSLSISSDNKCLYYTRNKEPMGHDSTSAGGKRSSKKRKSSRKQKSRRKNNKKRKSLKRKSAKRRRSFRKFI
jgi:hypothetical protein